uniref:Uncharacterized protein n=1 Tax=Panagrolaimus sp. ES5 TaxID=591445 RepID=A0AC34FSN0_9BILA
MSELRDRVTYSAYTDLLIDRDQITPFGVQSTWHQTPEHSEPEEEAIKPKQKAVEPKIREIRSLSARKKEREREEGNNKEIKNFRPLSAQKAPKRNVRMFKGAAAANSSTTPTENDPFRIADDYGDSCPCLSKCDYCDQIVEVQKLNEHHLNRCKFVNGDLVPCSLCGLACYTGEKSHPRCRKMKPPENSEWCPLCSIAVRPHNSKEAWDKHLKTDCYNNPRKGGVPDPGWDYSLPDNIGEPAVPPKSKEPPSNQPSPNPYPYPYPNPNPNQPSQQPPPPQPNAQNPPNNPSAYPQQYVYAQNPVNADTIKDAFQKIKDDREAELKVMRKKQAERERKEEEATEIEAKRLEQEVDKLKKKRKEEEATKKKKK